MCLKFSVNIFTSDEENTFVVDFINKLSLEAFQFGTNLAFRYETLSGIKKVYGYRKKLVMIVIEKIDEFLDIYAKIDREIYALNGIYLIVLINGEIREVQEIFQLLWKLQIFNVIVMFENEHGEILVKTFMPFNDQNCKDTTPILINKFFDGKFVNGTEKFLPRKFANLHYCPVRVSISDLRPFTIAKKSQDGKLILSGRDIFFTTALSKSLNFRVDFVFNEETGYFYENGTSAGTLKALSDGRADMSVGNWWIKASRSKFFDASNSYASDILIFVVPPGRKFTALEQLVYPFKFMSWMFIIACFVVGFVVIFIIKHNSKEVESFVFGTAVKHPYLNLFVAFIGGSQTKLPRRNFSRFLLMLFLMYSLVIRTVYQGSFYELLKSNRGESEVQSLEEVIEKKFSFFVFLGNEDIFLSSKAFADR